MEPESPEAEAFLFQLYNMTQGDIEAHVSMHDVGAALGLSENEAGTMAESLYIQGLAELKTLSGGIGITREGLRALKMDVGPGNGDELLSLGSDPVLGDPEKETVNQMVQEIKESVFQSQKACPELEEIVMDLKTIEVQMLSPRPKTNIIREIFVSLKEILSGTDQAALAARLEMVIAP